MNHVKPSSFPIRVVPLLQDVGRVAGCGHVIVIAVELWTNRFIIRFARYSKGSIGAEPKVIAWHAMDNVGTTYEWEGSGSRLLEDGLVVGECRFRPCLQPGVSQIHVEAWTDATTPSPYLALDLKVPSN